MLNRPIQLKPCPKCNILPVKDKRRVMLGKICDGGYTVTQGRYKCPNCQRAPSWGKCYCVDIYGWDEKEIEVWNDEVEEWAKQTQ